VAIEEIAGSVVGGQPTAMQKKIVDLIGKNQLLEYATEKIRKSRAQAMPYDSFTGSWPNIFWSNVFLV
jgi:hypothetical protein